MHRSKIVPINRIKVQVNSDYEITDQEAIQAAMVFRKSRRFTAKDKGKLFQVDFRRPAN